MNDSTRTVLTSVIAVLLFIIVETYTNDLGVSENKLLVIRAMIFCLGMLVGVGITNFIITKTTKPFNPHKFPPIKPLSAVLVASTALLLLSQGVSASTPQYTFTDSINATLDNTNNQNIGLFVFTKQAQTPETINVTDFTVVTAEQFDKLVWTNVNYTVDFVDPNNVHQIIIPGAQYFVPIAGTYTFTALSNPLLQGSVVVQTANELTATITGNMGPFPVRFSPSTFTLSSAQQIVNVTTDIPTDFPPNTLTFNATFITNAMNNTYNKTLRLPEVRKWSVTSNNLPQNFSIRGGDTQDLGLVVVRNDGNVNFDIASQITGDGQSYVTTQSNLTLFKNTNTQFDFRVRIPTKQADGVYNASIRLYGYGTEYLDSVLLTVKDLLPPTLSNLTFSDEYLQHTVRITAYPLDNIDVNKTTLNVNGKEYVMAKDNNAFFVDLVFADPIVYNFKVCSTDPAGNLGCGNFTKQFKLLEIIKGSPSLDFPSKKDSVYTTVSLFNISEKPPKGLSLRLDNFQPSTDTSNLSIPLIAENNGLYSVRVVDGDGSYQYFSGLNTSVQVFSAGQIQLEVRARKEALDNSTRSSFSGVVSVQDQPWRTPYASTSFKGITVDYALPDAFKIDWGTGGGFLDCKVRDTGDLETSRGICDLELPAADLSKDLIVPISLKEKQYLEDQVNQTSIAYEKRLLQRNVLSGVLLGLLVILTVYSIWSLVVQPRLIYFRNQ